MAAPASPAGSGQSGSQPPRSPQKVAPPPMTFDNLPTAMKDLLDAYQHAGISPAEMFAKWDTSGDGSLSENEFRKVLKLSLIHI